MLGELAGGFLIGPSVLGAIFPSVYHTLFLGEGVGLALSMFSWVGAILLLLIAGLEVDLHILRHMAKPGALTAAFAIVVSLVTGTLFAWKVLGLAPTNGFFLGLVLSVTGVSVVAKILIERDALRRGYAQVILAAGIAGEVLAWPLISLVASLRTGHAVTAGARTMLFLILFFAFMMTVGRRFTFWAMRRTADLTNVVNGQLSLVLVLAFVAAGITEALGLHALLGAFAFGVLLSQAPRATIPLKESVQTLAVGLFAPIFFVLAGMRVDVFRLRDWSSVTTLLLLFAVATITKVGSGAFGARLGRLAWWDSLLVGIGVNVKGGSDVIVAILGVQLGLFSTETYTMYAVVAILTVLISPPLLMVLEKKVPPSQQELARLNREEARRRAYLSDVERVLVPMFPELLPAISASLIGTLAEGKQKEGEIFDITELSNVQNSQTNPALHVESEQLEQAEETLKVAGEYDTVELTKGVAPEQDALQAILEAGKKHNLIAIGARPPQPGPLLSFGELQDRLIHDAESDVLIAIRDSEPSSSARRILVPISTHEHSMSGADLAAYLAKAHEAELVLFNVMHAKLDALFWKERKHRDLLEAGYRFLRDAALRIERLEVRSSSRVELGEDAGEEIIKELRRNRYDMVVLGAVYRKTSDRLNLGRTIQSVLTRTRIPAVVLVSNK